MSALIGQAAFPRASAPGTEECVEVTAVAAMLAIEAEGVPPLVAAGLLRRAPQSAHLFRRRDVGDLLERLFDAALGTTADARGMPLVEAFDQTGLPATAWGDVIGAILVGKINIFRRPGSVRDVDLCSFLVSSEHVLDIWNPGRTHEAPDPFIWTPRR